MILHRAFQHFCGVPQGHEPLLQSALIVAQPAQHCLEIHRLLARESHLAQKQQPFFLPVADLDLHLSLALLETLQDEATAPLLLFNVVDLLLQRCQARLHGAPRRLCLRQLLLPRPHARLQLHVLTNRHLELGAQHRGLSRGGPELFPTLLTECQRRIELLLHLHTLGPERGDLGLHAHHLISRSIQLALQLRALLLCDDLHALDCLPLHLNLLPRSGEVRLHTLLLHGQGLELIAQCRRLLPNIQHLGQQ
mmetsp:Transcript_89619/g.192039  ORF Transcript_89619/g.192039 Transcript_89619/m.192039 type:complete len:251 (-) Transcript_89619:89-841(-)